MPLAMAAERRAETSEHAIGPSTDGGVLRRVSPLGVESFHAQRPLSIEGLVSISPISSSSVLSTLGVLGGSGVDSASSVDSGISPVSDRRAKRDQFRSDIKALFDAVKSGDMTAAQKAAQQLEADNASLYGNGAPTNGNANATPTNTRDADMQALLDAVKSGNADDAKKALDKLQADRAAERQQGGSGGHHHHHHGASSSSASSSSSGGAATLTLSITYSAGSTANAATGGGVDTDGDGDGTVG